MTRDTTAESKSKDSSSESPEENFDKLVADLGEKLGPKENKELKQIMDGLRSAKTNEQEIGAYVRNNKFIYKCTSNSVNLSMFSILKTDKNG